MLIAVNFSNPTLWAVMLAWVLTVVLHEFSHGLVAYLGGDHTIAERGGLTLNPLQYVDPVMSIGLPLLFLLTGGVPLPGGVTYIRTDLLRSRAWASAVSLAGPACNFLLFLGFALPFHPRINWIHPPIYMSEWSTFQLFMGTMVVLQFEMTMINLIPIPPLDGFGAIRPYFDEQTQAKFNQPMVNYAGLAVLFVVILGSHTVVQSIYNAQQYTLDYLGFGDRAIEGIRVAFNKVLANQ